MHIKIKNGKNQYTPFGGTFLISELYESMKIGSFVDNHLNRAGSNRGYRASEYAYCNGNGFCKRNRMHNGYGQFIKERGT